MGKVTLVCGPPCSGKSTWVREHAKPGDLVVDFDEIAHKLGSPSRHDHPPRVRNKVRLIRAMQESTAARHPGDAWIIRTLPDGADRRAVAQRLNARTVVLAPPVEDGLARARADGRPAWTAQAIRDWWDRYTPDGQGDGDGGAVG